MGDQGGGRKASPRSGLRDICLLTPAWGSWEGKCDNSKEV